jgi:hypothetical protein
MANAAFDFSGLSVTRTYTFPDATGTLALTTGSSSITTVGTITTGVWHGTLIGVLYGGTGADLSGTGGTSQFLKQASAGAAVTVVRPALADLSDAATVALLASPTFTGTVTTAALSSTSILASSDVKVTTAGKGLFVKEGSNAKQGTATLVLGTAVVSNTSVTATSRIQLTAQSLGTVTVPSALAVSARTASTSFTILASDLSDTSVVAYEIFEPA